MEKIVILKGFLQSDQLKQHMVTIGIDKLLSNIAMYDDRCLESINKLYTSSVKSDDQNQYKYILEVEMFSTPYIFTYKSPISPGTSMTVKNPSTIKSLHLFTEVLDVKRKTSVLWVGAAKSKRKAIISGSMLCSILPNRIGHTKIN